LWLYPHSLCSFGVDDQSNFCCYLVESLLLRFPIRCRHEDNVIRKSKIAWFRQTQSTISNFRLCLCQQSPTPPVPLSAFSHDASVNPPRASVSPQCLPCCHSPPALSTFRRPIPFWNVNTTLTSSSDCDLFSISQTKTPTGRDESYNI